MSSGEAISAKVPFLSLWLYEESITYVLQAPVADHTITRYSPVVHSSQHQHSRIDIIVHADNMLSIVKPMETATNVAALCQDDSWFDLRLFSVKDAVSRFIEDDL